MSATGSFVSPMFIFKRLRMEEHLVNDAPVGSIGDCPESGWVNEDLFGKWLIHFKNFTKCSPGNPVLLVADNYSSHISLKIFYFLRENRIKFVTIPTHTSHHLQPLDVLFLKPLKINYAENVRLWLMQNLGQVVTPSRIAGIFSKAYLSSSRMELAVSGFAAAGIFPFSWNIFTLENFIADNENSQRNESIENIHEATGVSDVGETSSSAENPTQPLYEQVNSKKARRIL